MVGEKEAAEEDAETLEPWPRGRGGEGAGTVDLAGAEGVVSMEERMTDIKRRYGSYPQEKWDANMALRSYFEEKAGEDIYLLVKDVA